MGCSSSSSPPKTPQNKQLNNLSTVSEEDLQTIQCKIPFSSKYLAFSQNISSIKSPSSQTQISLTTEQIKKQWQGKKITKIEKYESPLEVSYWDILKPSRHILKHWQIIATINDCLFWLISFGEKGLQNERAFTKNELISKRKDNVRFEEYTPEREIFVEHVLDIIEAVKDKPYNIGDWNCQLFTDHIVKKIKSP